ncbi:hypothetical protein Mp_3g04740 [Marchantia polymorpha subsp. ruderalis]|uniref:Uncharacterized protein n=2 Tax=Marchantia polymorpha TaxID=3197 RepID=A0AAF6AXG7_MARPO|nr:hypothetical protein MARPO_0022s0055 [Marchantia polymorpha]BBN04451.1 hypothetical protein Mp_3g04740 [Marchantia polymorpha subsp. ruderalis]|eukprot:PTQ43951.1 hypothetical protein MARPO_0022s0055 [Marchantia polymorpha]
MQMSLVTSRSTSSTLSRWRESATERSLQQGALYVTDRKQNADVTFPRHGSVSMADVFNHPREERSEHCMPPQDSGTTSPFAPYMKHH